MKHDLLNQLKLNLDFRFLAPLTTGDYPQNMRSLVGRRLPKFSEEQTRLINGSFDFIGINYYTSRYAADAPHLNNTRPCYLTDSLTNVTSKHKLLIHHLLLINFNLYLYVEFDNGMSCVYFWDGS
jgi:beta-glucosidase